MISKSNRTHSDSAFLSMHPVPPAPPMTIGVGCGSAFLHILFPVSPFFLLFFCVGFSAWLVARGHDPPENSRTHGNGSSCSQAVWLVDRRGKFNVGLTSLDPRRLTPLHHVDTSKDLSRLEYPVGTGYFTGQAYLARYLWGKRNVSFWLDD